MIRIVSLILFYHGITTETQEGEAVNHDNHDEGDDGKRKLNMSHRGFLVCLAIDNAFRSSFLFSDCELREGFSNAISTLTSVYLFRFSLLFISSFFVSFGFFCFSLLLFFRLLLCIIGGFLFSFGCLLCCSLICFCFSFLEGFNLSVCCFFRSRSSSFCFFVLGNGLVPNSCSIVTDCCTT